MMAQFHARYDGECAYEHCQIRERKVIKGDPITWVRKKRKGDPSIVYHQVCFEQMNGGKPQPAPNPFRANSPEPENGSTPQPKPIPTPTPMPDNGNPLEALAAGLMPYFQQHFHPAVEVDYAKITRDVEAIAQKYAGARTITVERPGYEPVKVDCAHESLDTLLYLVSLRLHSYLWGDPGSGKSHAAAQVAEALGLQFGYISLNPQTPESRLLGYMDATGTYRETVFRRIWETGGVFCIDELDNASPALLTCLNGCLENGHAGFPDQMVQRHDDFVVVATGNTSGRGANPRYPDRRPFDSAFAERFQYLEWRYDVQLERELARRQHPDADRWVDWIHVVRAHADEHKLRLTVSPRASIRGAQLAGGPLDVETIADMCLFKGIDDSTRAAVLDACGKPPKLGKRPVAKPAQAETPVEEVPVCA